MNKLTRIERAKILLALVEGNSIASTCRMFGVNKITVLRLLADAGTLAAQFHDLTVCDLETKRVQMDEIWSFVGAKQRNVKQENWGKGQGDNWVWVSLDADTKGLFKNNLFNYFAVEQSYNSSLHETRAASNAHSPSPHRSP